MAKKKESVTTSAGQPIDAILTGERILPEAPASINVKIAWNGGDVMLTLRGFSAQEALNELLAIMPALEEQGMTIAGRSAPAQAKPAKAKPQKSAPVKEVPEPGEVDETVIDVTSIWVHQGKKNKMAFVKGTPGYEEEGVVAFDDAFKGSGYDLQSQDAGQRYSGEDFGFVRAVIRFVDGKPRVWRFLTEREKIPF